MNVTSPLLLYALDCILCLDEENSLNSIEKSSPVRHAGTPKPPEPVKQRKSLNELVKELAKVTLNKQNGGA